MARALQSSAHMCAAPNVTRLRPTLVSLPEPACAGSVSVEEAIARRRSSRRFGPQSLTLAEVGQLLWAAQGITGPDGGRAAPSAGATHPLTAHLVVERVEGIAPGVYAYEPAAARLRQVVQGSVANALVAAARHQEWIGAASAGIAISAEYGRSTVRYRERGYRYAHLEAGHAAENAHLEATALGLRSVIVGAFDDAALARVLSLGSGARSLCLLIVGKAP
jgi:SagB-type dehydrogenase family enzyme